MTEERKPDLICYYKYSDIYKTILADFKTPPKDNTEIINSNVDVYADENLTQPIGWLVANIQTWFDEYSNIIGRQANKVLTLPFGSLAFQDTRYDLLTINPDTNRSEFKNNSVVVSTITSGNKNLLGATGYVAIITTETPIRAVLIYFDKK